MNRGERFVKQRLPQVDDGQYFLRLLQIIETVADKRSERVVRWLVDELFGGNR